MNMMVLEKFFSTVMPNDNSRQRDVGNAADMPRMRHCWSNKTRAGICRLVAALAFVGSLALSGSATKAQDAPGPQWRDVQKLLRENGFTGVSENNERSDWASNRALIMFCRNVDCAKYQQPNQTPTQDIESWIKALQEGLARRTAGSRSSVELANVRPVETRAVFIDSGNKVASFNGDDFSIWQAGDFKQLSLYRLGLSGTSPSSWEYDLVLSAEQRFSAAINKLWITILDNRSGLIVGWLPLTLMDGSGFDKVKNLDRSAVQFLGDTNKLVVARSDGLVGTFDWVTGETRILRDASGKDNRAKPIIASSQNSTRFMVGFERQTDLLVVDVTSNQLKAITVAAPSTQYWGVLGINQAQALFKADGKPNTGFVVDLAAGRAQAFKAESICKYAVKNGFRSDIAPDRKAVSNNGSLSLIEQQFECEEKTLVSFGSEICRAIPCQDYTTSVDVDASGNKILIALRTGFALLKRNLSPDRKSDWKILLPPTLSPHGLSSDLNNAPFVFSERGRIFNAAANSDAVRLKANLDSTSVVSVVNAPGPSDWVALSASGELTVQVGGVIRRVALSGERSPDNSQLFVTNDGRTAVVVLPTSKNPTSKDWGGSDVAVIDIGTLTIKKSFRVNPVKAPQGTPQVWVLSQTTATMLNDGRHLAIAIFEPVIQIFDIQTGARVKIISTAPKDLRWANSELASSKFVTSLKSSDEKNQALYSSPAKLSPRGMDGLRIALGITGFINVNMVAKTDSVFSGAVTAQLALLRFNQVLETANPDEYLTLFVNGLFAKLDSQGNTKTVYARDGVSRAARLGNGGLIYAIAPDGIVRLFDEKSGNLAADLAIYDDGEWLMKTPEGFFDGSQGGRARVAVRTGPMQAVSIDSFYDALYRPDLVREKLAGDPNGKVRLAAAQLDLEKVVASGAAPKVAISSPQSGTSSVVDEVEVEAVVTDQGGGIGKVEWRVNGLTLGVVSRGFERIDLSSGTGVGTGNVGASHTARRKLALEPGDNRIEVLAYNSRNLIASEAAQVTVKWNGEKTATPPKLYVLAVGVNDYYDSRLHLAYAVSDATALAEAFMKTGKGLYASVEVKTVLDGDVTLANLNHVFDDLSEKVQPRDVFVFFLAGHGKTKNGRYYFLPRDFRYEDESSIEKAGMGQDKFQAWFAEIPARKSLLLYDTCESGSLTGATRGSDIDERLGALNRMARATGRTFLTATTDDAPALEGYHGHGVFTYALLDALDHADVNKNGLIEVSELADYIDQKVPDYSYEAFKLRQIPQRSVVGNNFALTNRAEVLGVAAIASTKDASPIPAKPTHVVVAQSDVKSSASDGAASVMRLAPGTQVRLLETQGGWVLIAREGQKLGYVQQSAVAGLQ